MMSKASTLVDRRMRQLTRMLMLVVGVVSVPSVGPAAMQRPHCAQHDPAAQHRGGHQMPDPGRTSWEGATKHDCPHCPATECARIAPCTASSNAAVSPASLAVTVSAPQRNLFRPVQHELHSKTHQPPTPPPQLIS